MDRISGSKVIKTCKTIANFSCWRLSRSLGVNSVLTVREVHIVTYCLSKIKRIHSLLTQCFCSVEWLPICWLWRVLLWSQHPALTGKNPLTRNVTLFVYLFSEWIWGGKSWIKLKHSPLNDCFLKAKKHNLTVNLTTFRIWCYVCEREVFLEHRPSLVPLPAAPHHCKATEQVRLHLLLGFKFDSIPYCYTNCLLLIFMFLLIVFTGSSSSASGSPTESRTNCCSRRRGLRVWGGWA